MTDSKDQLAGKAVLVGELQTGKTSLILRLTENSFFPDQRSTLVSSITDYHGEYKSNPFHLLVWDTSGQEKFRSLNQIFYRDAIIVILVYDITRRETFTELETYWIKQIKETCPAETVICVVGNKADLFQKQEVTEDEGRNFAKKHDAIFALTSCFNGDGVKELFDEAAERAILRKLMGTAPHLNLDDVQEEKKGCCGSNKK